MDDPDNASHDVIDQALDGLFAVVTGQAGSDGSSPTATESAEKPKVVDAAARQLSASELRACAAQGCTPRDFLRAKRLMGVR